MKPPLLDAADMNDHSIKYHVTPYLHSVGLGPSTFGERTTAEPRFPIRGALWGYNQRPFFTIISKCCVAFEMPMTLAVCLDYVTESGKLTIIAHAWQLPTPSRSCHAVSICQQTQYAVHQMPPS